MSLTALNSVLLLELLDIDSLTEPSGVIAPSCATTFTNAVIAIKKANARIDDDVIKLLNRLLFPYQYSILLNILFNTWR